MSACKAEMYQNPFRLKLCPRPGCGSLQCSPRLPSWNKGDLLLREVEGEGRGRGGDRKGREGRGRRREGSGAKGTPMCIFKFSFKQPM